MKITQFLCVAMLLFATGISKAQIPFQAKLLENNQPVNGTKNLTFSIQEGSVNWAETHNNHPVVNGLYSVILGSQNALPADLFDGVSFRNLQISIDGVALTSVKVYKPFGNINNQRINTVYLKDIKPAGIHGGPFPAGTWITRDLNTVEGAENLVTLQNNQFILPEGKYEIEASSPAYYVGEHKIKLRNITDGADVIIGTVKFSSYTSTGSDVTNSELKGVIYITSSKVFEIQHRCLISRTLAGLGAGKDFGVPEIYTQVKITKIQ